MAQVLHFAPRIVALVAWVLAVTVAVGASTPRLRAPGRERAARAGMARAGSQRPDDPRAWLAPGTEHDPEYTVADAVIDASAERDLVGHSDGPLWPVPPARWATTAPSGSSLADPRAPNRRLTRWRARSASGRAPPLA